MKLINKIKNWWKQYQEKNSERYLERERLKDELNEMSKDLDVILKSSAGKVPNYALERATFIQNIFLQRKLTDATNGLKAATWILALATIIFAWTTIIDSPNSSYFISTLQNIAGVVAYIFIIFLALVLIWNLLRFLIRFGKKFFRRD